jgi:protein-S-isoprenylcysteine O-methyltransferase Ste14
MATSGGIVQSVASGVALVGFYSFVLWRIAKRNAGNKVIEVGTLALVVFFIMVAAIKIPNLPDWVVPSLGVLFLLIGLVMILFLMQQGYNAIRRRKRSR